MPLNAFHEPNAANSYAWGQRLAGAIELALADLERTRKPTAQQACAIAEAIIENGAGADAFADSVSLYAGALDGSPRYSDANHDVIMQRSVRRAVA